MKTMPAIGVLVAGMTLAGVGGFTLAPLADKPATHEAPRSSKWPKVREDYLKVHPGCESCGLVDKGNNVHHVLPFHLFPELELDAGNFVTLCTKHGCHFLIGHCANFEFYNTHVREDAALILSRVKESQERAAKRKKAA